MHRGVRSAIAIVSASLLGGSTARADEPVIEPKDLTSTMLRTSAERVSFDARQRVVELDGDVRVDASPFHLRSEHLTLTRTNLGIDVEGRGSVAFCPCLGTPLRIDFERAIVAPPGDLILRSPTLRIYGVPAMHLPYFWLRSTEKAGILPPDIAYRGQDGVFLGGGVHLPWKTRAPDGSSGRAWLDLRSGAYLLGGFAADARLRTPSTTTTVRFDRRASASAPALPFDPHPDEGGADEGFRLDARGSLRTRSAGAAWDVDALRGRRGVVSSTDLDEASRPWDRASGESSLRSGPFVVSTAVRAVTRRGTALSHVDAVGPAVRARASGAVARGITYDLTTEGGALRVSDDDRRPSLGFGAGADVDRARTLSFARAEAGLSAATSFGPMAASASARGIGDVALETNRSGADRAAALEARLGLPLARPYGPGGPDAWVHVVEPFARASLLHARSDGLLGFSPGRAIASVSGTAPLASVGVATSFGRASSNDAVELEASVGGAGDDAIRTVTALGRGRLAARTVWFGATVDAATLLRQDELRSGAAILGRVRLGKTDGVRVLGNVATREGVDPVLARALSNAPLEPSSGFLAFSGTTAGAGLVVPWSRVLTTSAGADVDASDATLVAARGGIELRDRCGCVTLRALGARRIGRGGFDAWLAIDIGTSR